MVATQKSVPGHIAAKSHCGVMSAGRTGRAASKEGSPGLDPLRKAHLLPHSRYRVAKRILCDLSRMAWLSHIPCQGTL